MNMRKRKKPLILFSICLIILIGYIANARSRLPESYYQKIWCDERNGITEFVLPDKARCDCLTDEYAVEFDFAKKWAEAIGQSLYYASQTGKKPGIVLIMDGEKDEKYLKRIMAVVEFYDLPIKVLSMAR